MDLVYEKKEVTPAGLVSFLEIVKKDPEVIGCNVTLPLKEILAQHVDELSDEARFIGAGNVIHHYSGKLKSYNTDVLGILKTIERNKLQLAGEDVLILGAGGSAKALVYVLGQLKVKNVFVFNPRSNRGEGLVQMAQQQFPQTHFENTHELRSLKKDLMMVVNTTPIGMGQPDPAADLFFSSLTGLNFKAHALAFDFIYNPLTTPFMKWADKAGLKNVNGLGMLIDQALGTWSHWFGADPNLEQHYSGLSTYLQGFLHLKNQHKPLCLTGFMGAGKSSVAQKISELTGLTLIDTDKCVEEAEAMTVAQIFADKGESYFREAEKKELQKALTYPKAIIALGGGALLRPEVFKLVQEQSTLVYLAAEEDELVKRLMQEADRRPLLKGLSDQERRQKLHDLLLARKSHYEQVMIKVDTSKKSVAEVAFAILSEVK